MGSTLEGILSFHGTYVYVDGELNKFTYTYSTIDSIESAEIDLTDQVFEDDFDTWEAIGEALDLNLFEADGQHQYNLYGVDEEGFVMTSIHRANGEPGFTLDIEYNVSNKPGEQEPAP